jgi:hypothetical protein
LFDFYINQHIFGMGSAGLGTGDTNVLSEYFSMDETTISFAFLLQILRSLRCPGILNYPVISTIPSLDNLGGSISNQGKF